MSTSGEWPGGQLPPWGQSAPWGQPPSPIPGWGDPASLARHDLETERHRARQAWIAVLAYATCAVVSNVLRIVWHVQAEPRVRHFEVVHGRSPDVLELGRLTATGAQTVSSLVVVAVEIAAIVFFVRWVHSAANTARRLGWPARRSPGMAVGGWFIPVVNLWFPYQGVRDMLHPSDRRRGLVARWWTVHIAYAVGAGILGVVVNAVLGDRAATGNGPIVVYVIAILLSVAWVVAFRPVLDAVTAAHTDAIDRIVNPGAAPVA